MFHNHIGNKYREDWNSGLGCALEFMSLLLASEKPLNLHEIFVYKVIQVHFIFLRKGCKSIGSIRFFTGVCNLEKDNIQVFFPH